VAAHASSYQNNGNANGNITYKMHKIILLTKTTNKVIISRPECTYEEQEVEGEQEYSGDRGGHCAIFTGSC